MSDATVLVVETSLDPDVQHEAEAAVRTALARDGLPLSDCPVGAQVRVRTVQVTTQPFVQADRPFHIWVED